METGAADIDEMLKYDMLRAFIASHRDPKIGIIDKDGETELHPSASAFTFSGEEPNVLLDKLKTLFLDNHFGLLVACKEKGKDGKRGKDDFVFYHSCGVSENGEIFGFASWNDADPDSVVKIEPATLCNPMEGLNFSDHKPKEKETYRVPLAGDLMEMTSARAFFKNSDFDYTKISAEHKSAQEKPCDGLVLSNKFCIFLTEHGKLIKHGDDLVRGSSKALITNIKTMHRNKDLDPIDLLRMEPLIPFLWALNRGANGKTAAVEKLEDLKEANERKQKFDAYCTKIQKGLKEKTLKKDHEKNDVNHKENDDEEGAEEEKDVRNNDGSRTKSSDKDDDNENVTSNKAKQPTGKTKKSKSSKHYDSSDDSSSDESSSENDSSSAISSDSDSDSDSNSDSDSSDDSDSNDEQNPSAPSGKRKAARKETQSERKKQKNQLLESSQRFTNFLETAAKIIMPNSASQNAAGQNAQNAVSGMTLGSSQGVQLGGGVSGSGNLQNMLHMGQLLGMKHQNDLYQEQITVTQMQNQVAKSTLNEQKKQSKSRLREKSAMSSLTKVQSDQVRVLIKPLEGYTIGDEFKLKDVKFSEEFKSVVQKKSPDHLYSHIKQWINTKRGYRANFQLALFVGFIRKYGFVHDDDDPDQDLGGFSSCLFTVNRNSNQSKSNDSNEKHLRMILNGADEDEGWNGLLESAEFIEPITFDETTLILKCMESLSKELSKGKKENMLSKGYKLALKLMKQHCRAFEKCGNRIPFFFLHWLFALDLEQQLMFDVIHDKLMTNGNSKRFIIKKRYMRDRDKNIKSYIDQITRCQWHSQIPASLTAKYPSAAQRGQGVRLPESPAALSLWTDQGTAET